MSTFQSGLSEFLHDVLLSLQMCEDSVFNPAAGGKDTILFLTYMSFVYLYTVFLDTHERQFFFAATRTFVFVPPSGLTAGF